MLRTLKLSHFRCFESLRLALEPGVSAFIGANAQGKTSILEAVCVLLRLQSPRTNALNDLIRFEEPGFGLAGDWDGRALSVVNEHRKRRKLYHGGNEVERSRVYLEHGGLVVWMGNDDLGLVTGSGHRRRRYLDFQAAQLYPDYRSTLRSYEKALRSRNELLKQGRGHARGALDAYTAVLVEHGKVLTERRAALVEALVPFVDAAQRRISGSREALTLIYERGCGDDFAGALSECEERDRRRGLTHVGPHRDDVRIDLDGRPASRFASEGQQRTLALALKLGQLELLRDHRNATPILLVDDIFGELDPQRREALTESLPRESQKLITTTSLRWLPAEARDLMVYQVDAGSVVAKA